MRIDVVSLFPEQLRQAITFGVTGRAIEHGKIEIGLWNPRDYASDKHRSVDDRPYGGGPGMVMCVEPMRSAIRAARAADDRTAAVSLMSPQGKALSQHKLETLAQRSRLILVCGRYEGLDERLLELEIDEEWSLGDYVISGGELAAAVIIDAVVRLQPGVLGHSESALQDSFSNGLLDYPHYSRPEEVAGLTVPQVLLSGNHAEIERWRYKQALGRTWLRRPELLKAMTLDQDALKLLEEFKQEFEDDVSGTAADLEG